MKKLIEFKARANRKDVYRALLDNRTLKTCQGYSVFYDSTEQEPFRINKGDADEVYIYHDHSIAHEEIEVEWYDHIPEHGVLCWVWTHDADFKILALVFRYNSDKKTFIAIDNGHDDIQHLHALPASLSSINKFIVAK